MSVIYWLCCLLCRENNVEQVVLEGVPGYASILVKAYSVYAAAGAQPFALAVTGDFQGSLLQLDSANSGTCQVAVAGKHNPCLRFAVCQRQWGPGASPLGLLVWSCNNLPSLLVQSSQVGHQLLQTRLPASPSALQQVSCTSASSPMLAMPPRPQAPIPGR